MSDIAELSAHELRSFGRLRGRKLSERQARLMRELLPRLAPDIDAPAPQALQSLFNAPTDKVWLEIGFGGAEHLVWQARHNPSVGIIGCEPYEDGVAKALTAVEEDNLGNIRIHAGDARPLLRWLPPHSVSRAFILFPDPWPKKRHRKRRLVSRPLFDLLARALCQGAELRVGTDIGDYARTILESVIDHKDFRWLAAGPSDWRQRPADWPETRYEQKAAKEGRTRYYLRFERI